MVDQGTSTNVVDVGILDAPNSLPQRKAAAIGEACVPKQEISQRSLVSMPSFMSVQWAPASAENLVFQVTMPGLEKSLIVLI